MLEHNNIPDPYDQNHESLARLWNGLKINGDRKCYCTCSQCKGFKRRRIQITTMKRHCRKYGHAERGHHYHRLVSFS